MFRDELSYGTQRNDPVSPMHELLIALHFYACGTFQVVVGDSTVAVSQPTVSRIITTVTTCIVNMLGTFVNYPYESEHDAIK